MSTDTERLIFLLEANSKSLEKGLERAQKAADRRMNAMENRAVLMEKRLQASFARGGNSLAQLIGGTAVTAILAASAKGVAGLADSYTNLSNQAKLYTNTAEEAAVATQFVIDAAADARVPLEELTRVFAGASRAASQIGADAGEIQALTEVVAKTASISGTSTQAMAGGLTQLSQALGSTRIQAEEFNSIIDGIPALAQAAANGIDATGGSVGKLQKMVRDGELSNSQLFRALLSQLPQVQKAFAEVTPTIAGSFETLRTRLIEFIGGADDAVQATENISKFVLGLANNVELLGDASRVFVGEMAKIGSVAVPIAAVTAAVVGINRAMQAYAVLSAAVAVANLRTAGSFTVAGIATTGFAGAVRAATLAARGFILTPFGLALTAIAVALTIATANTIKKTEADAAATRAEEERSKALADYESAAIAAANADGEAKKAADALADSMRVNAERARRMAAEYLKAAEASLVMANAAFEASNAKDTELRASLASARAVADDPNASFRDRYQARIQVDRLSNQLGNSYEQERRQKANSDALIRLYKADQEVQAARRRLADAERSINTGDAARRGPGVVAVPATEEKTKKGPKGKDPAVEARRLLREAEAEQKRAARAAEQAAQDAREDRKAELEHQLDLARLRGENVDAREDELAIMQRAEQLANGEVPTARDTLKATQQIAEVRALINQQRQREADLAKTAEDLQVKRTLMLYEEARAAEDVLIVAQKTDQYVQDGLNREQAHAKAVARVAEERRAEQAAAEAQLDTQLRGYRVDRLIAEGKFAQAEAAQRLLDLEARTLEFREKNVPKAEEAAESVQKELDAQRELNRLRGDQDVFFAREIELLRARGLDREAERKERVVQAEKDARAEAERRGTDYNPEDAAKRLTEDEEAKLEGQLRDVWRNGIKAALSGDFRDFLSNLLSKVFDRAAENLADAIFDAVKGARSAAGAAGTGSGTSNWMAAAAKIIPFVFGGRRETGGSAQRGKSYLVGENGPEMFTAGANGVISAGAGVRRGPGTTTIYVNARDAVLASQLRQDMQNAVAQGLAWNRAYGQRETALEGRYKGK